MEDKTLGLILAIIGFIYFIMIAVAIVITPYFVVQALIGAGIAGIVILLLLNIK